MPIPNEVIVEQPPTQDRRPTRRRLVALSFATVLVAGAAVGVWVRDDATARARADDPNLAVAHVSTTTVATAAPPADVTPPPTTAAAPALSQPSDPPTDPNAKVPIVHVGQIDIPKIGLSSPVYEGVWLTVLNEGPGHWPGTPMPGGYGNVVIAGHRVTHSHPFRNIDRLAAGDQIMLHDDHGGAFTYAVTGSEVVTPDGLRIVDQTPGHTLTLFACHPPGSAQYRYVVHAQLVSPST